MLHPADDLIDGMRGSSSLWYRVRINLQHVPEADRPEQGELLADLRPLGRQDLAGCWSGREQVGVELAVVAEQHRVRQLCAGDLGERRGIQHEQKRRPALRVEHDREHDAVIFALPPGPSGEHALARVAVRFEPGDWVATGRQCRS